MPQEKLSRSIGVFTLVSQPPNFGEALSVMQVIDKFDILILCFKTPAQLIPLAQLQQQWSLLLKGFKDKVVLTSWDEDFSEISVLPEGFADATILTISKTVYAHLASMGIKTELVPRVKGYHNVFYRTAYRSSCALDYIVQHYGAKQ